MHTLKVTGQFGHDTAGELRNQKTHLACNFVSGASGGTHGFATPGVTFCRFILYYEVTILAPPGHVLDPPAGHPGVPFWGSKSCPGTRFGGPKSLPGGTFWGSKSCPGGTFWGSKMVSQGVKSGLKVHVFEGSGGAKLLGISIKNVIFGLKVHVFEVQNARPGG